jgi:hypothetical protein
MNDRENPQPRQHAVLEVKHGGYFAGLFGAILGLSSLVCVSIEIVRLIKWVSGI